MKMKTVYEANPALGDPMSIQGQLTENGHRLDKLRSDFRRYQGWLEEADGSPASTLSIRTNGQDQNSPRRSSVSDEVIMNKVWCPSKNDPILTLLGHPDVYVIICQKSFND